VTHDELTSYYEELYFDEFYRVLVLRDESGYLVSVDVYAKKNSFEYSNRICIDKVCLLVKELETPREVLHGVIKVLIVAVKVHDNPVEVVSVKWILDHKPSREEIEELYKASWRLLSSF